MRYLTPLQTRLLVGVGIKSLGYLIVASGIFLSLKDKALALKIVYLGVCFVVFGWFLILRALRLAKSLGFERKGERIERQFRISAHVDGGLFGIKEGDTLKVRGLVKERVGRYWKNADGNVLLVLNWIPVKKTKLNDGKFEFRIPNLKEGLYEVHVRFVEGCEEKRLKVRVMSFEEWRRNLIFVLIVTFAIAIVMSLPLFVLIR